MSLKLSQDKNHMRCIYTKPCGIQRTSGATGKQNRVIHEHTSKDPWRQFRFKTHTFQIQQPTHTTQVSTYRYMEQAERDQQKVTDKAVIRPHLGYASTSWPPLASDTNIHKIRSNSKCSVKDCYRMR